jgi:hypothetical protein
MLQCRDGKPLALTEIMAGADHHRFCLHKHLEPLANSTVHKVITFCVSYILLLIHIYAPSIRKYS